MNLNKLKQKMDFNPNLKSSMKKAIKIGNNEMNKMPKVSNFFRGEIVTNNKQPKRLSHDKKEIFYTSRIKESEIEPKLLLEKLPPAFNLKHNRNSNSKETTNTKYSSNEQKNKGYTKLNLNNSNETSPEEIVKINFSKPKKKGEDYKKRINNYFIEEEINIQKQLQIKKNNNKINNKRVSSYKIVTKNDKNKDKNIFIYNNTNTNNNSHLKTDFSEYENIKQRNNFIDSEYDFKYNYNMKKYIKNSTFNKTNEDKYKNFEQKYKLNTININNINSKNNNLIYNNDLLNTSDSIKKKYRKTSDPDTYHTEINELKNINNEMKKNIRSGSYMNMINCQNILQTDSYYSPVSTNTNVHTITNLTNNNFSMGGNTIKETEDFKLSGNLLLKNIFPQKNNNEKMQKKLKSSKYYNNNIRSIKNITKITKIPMISGGLLGGININLKYNNNGHNNNQHYENNNKEINNSIKQNKKEIENINEGITFRYYNGYKYYFNLRSANIYFLKEVQYNLAKGISSSINIWNKYFHNNNSYLNIICRKVNTPENHYTFIIEYPRGGENIYDIIDSVGLHEEKFVYKIISEIYNNIKIIKKENNDIIKEYQNIPFCLCDIFLTINEEIKIMPPVIRKIHSNSNNKIKKGDNNGVCECKKNFEILKSNYNICDNSLFCLGLSTLQLITQNLLFKMKSYNILINQKNNKNIKSTKPCCLFHSLLYIEQNNTKDKMLSNFLSLYNPHLSNFIHQCTKFDTHETIDINTLPKSDFLDSNPEHNTNINISIKELFKIIPYITNNAYISENNFFKTFDLLYKEMKLNIINFKKLLHENKVINVLIRSFDIDKSDFKNKFKKIINTSINDLQSEEYDENKNFVNSGSCFYRSSLRKKLENNGNKNINEINIENVNDNEQGIIIFKNYNNENV